MANIQPQEAFGFQEAIPNPIIQPDSLAPEKGNWETQQNTAMNDAIRRPSIFHIGSDTPPRNSVSQPQQASFSIVNPAPTGTPNLFPPILVDSFCREISPLNPGIDSSLLYGDHHFVTSPPSRTLAEQNFGSIGGTQMGISHSNLNGPPAMGAANLGRSFILNQPIALSFGEMGPYNPPVSNFAPELPLVQQQCSGEYRLNPILPGSGDGGFSIRNKITMNPPLNHTRSQEIQPQGLMNQNSGQNGFYNFAGAGGSSRCQALNANGMGSQMFPLHGEDLSGKHQNKRQVIENYPNTGQLGSPSTPARTPKRPIARQSNNNIPHSAMPAQNLHLGGSWLSQSRSSLGLTTTSDGRTMRPRAIKNSVYDPLYEQMGLPIDPHLRMFLAKRDGF